MEKQHCPMKSKIKIGLKWKEVHQTGRGRDVDQILVNGLEVK